MTRGLEKLVFISLIAIVNSSLTLIAVFFPKYGFFAVAVSIAAPFAAAMTAIFGESKP